MKLNSLKKLFVEQLKDLYSAETQLIDALPRMVDAATDSLLKDAFNNHLEETKTQQQRIELIFQHLEFSPSGHKCKAMAGLIEESKDMSSADGEPEVIDAGLIAGAQRIEHYEIAGYGTVVKYAKMLGNDYAAELLQMTLDEEYAADTHLDKLANSINVEAMAQ